MMIIREVGNMRASEESPFYSSVDNTRIELTNGSNISIAYLNITGHSITSLLEN